MMNTRMDAVESNIRSMEERLNRIEGVWETTIAELKGDISKLSKGVEEVTRLLLEMKFNNRKDKVDEAGLEDEYKSFVKQLAPSSAYWTGVYVKLANAQGNQVTEDYQEKKDGERNDQFAQDKQTAMVHTKCLIEYPEEVMVELLDSDKSDHSHLKLLGPSTQQVSVLASGFDYNGSPKMINELKEFGENLRGDRYGIMGEYTHIFCLHVEYLECGMESLCKLFWDPGGGIYVSKLKYPCLGGTMKHKFKTYMKVLSIGGLEFVLRVDLCQSEMTEMEVVEGTPELHGYRMPAEWEPHSQCWMGWPAYSSSKRRVAEWDKLEDKVKKEEKEDQLDGEAAVNKEFGENFLDSRYDLVYEMSEEIHMDCEHAEIIKVGSRLWCEFWDPGGYIVIHRPMSMYFSYEKSVASIENCLESLAMISKGAETAQSTKTDQTSNRHTNCSMKCPGEKMEGFLDTASDYSTFMEVVKAVARQGSASRASVALIADQKSYGYSQLLASASRISCLLSDPDQKSVDGIIMNKDLGGARIGVVAKPSAEFVAGILATWMSGGVAVPLVLSYPETELLHVMTDADVSMILSTEDHSEIMQNVATKSAARFSLIPSVPNMPSPTTEHDQSNEGNVDADKSLLEIEYSKKIKEEDHALILYTSGTTGKPKGVVHTHKSIFAQVETLASAWEYTSTDHFLHCLPLHHVHGLFNALIAPLYAGSTVEFMPKFSVRGIWQKWWESYPKDGTKADYAVTVFTGVPTMYTRLIQGYEAMDVELRDASASAASHLRLMLCGSSALPLPVMQQWETITGHRLLERYGMTEFVMALSNPLKGMWKGGTVGKPFAGVEVKILAEDDGSAGVGELCVKSPSLFKEYWKRPEVTKESFIDDGFFKTGDAVRLYTKMRGEGIRPNNHTFTAILTACWHSGLVDEGRKHFESMRNDLPAVYVESFENLPDRGLYATLSSLFHAKWDVKGGYRISKLPKGVG